MKNIWKWVLGIAIVLALFFGPTLFRLAFPTLGYGYGMMGRGHYGGMMGFGFFPFMGLMWLAPLGTLALVVLGIVWLVNNVGGSKPAPTQPQPQPQTRTCASCGAAAQADWKTCPYCGSDLE